MVLILLQVLRFSRLFPPQYPISLYKKKKKTEDGDKAAARPTASDEIEMNWGAAAEPEQMMKDEQVLL